jgi:hypothetical protein
MKGGWKPRRIPGHRHQSGRQERRVGAVDRGGGRRQVLAQRIGRTAPLRGERYLPGMCGGLKGFQQALESVYPQAQVQLCIVHMIRASLNDVTWKDRKQVVKDFKPIYKATTADEAERQLSELGEKWPRYPAVSRLWRENWERVIPFFFPEEVRKIVYTTNAV